MAMPAALTLNAQPFAAKGLDAGTVLKRAPRGAYTTARTYQRNSVFEFETHVVRTAKSCALMLGQAGRPEVALRCANLTSVATLRPLMAESIAAAIECFDRDPAAAASSDAELKITMLITWGEGDADGTTAGGADTFPPGASGVATRPAESYGADAWSEPRSLKGPSARTVASVVDMLRSIGLGPEAVLLSECDDAGTATGTPDAGGPPPLSTAGSGAPVRTARTQQILQALGAQPFTLLTHVTPLPPRRPPPIRALVAGGPRENAAAKDSEWVRQRQALEASKPAGVEEILLFDAASGAVMEGTQTNVFALLWEEDAVADTASSTGASQVGGGSRDSPAGGAPKAGAPATPARSDDTVGGRSGWVLYTAGVGILEGTVRRLVLEVCASTPGMPRVELRAPLVHDLAAGRWAGAFITSTSRLVLPIDEVAFPAQYAAAAAASARPATPLASPPTASDADADTCPGTAKAGVAATTGDSLVRVAFPQPRPEVLVRLEHRVAEQVAAHSTRVLPTLH
jgi:branched-subunit amino acid aminotransferase/4-amino-4-deoxychorismate lyase